MKATVIMPTAGLVVVNDNRLLLAFSSNKQAWYLPGGKVDGGETTLQSLLREVKEELNIALDPALIKFYCRITAFAYGEQPNIVMEQDCYMYPFIENIRPSSEIAAVQFFDYQTYRKQEAQVDGVLQVFEKLKKDGLLA